MGRDPAPARPAELRGLLTHFEGARVPELPQPPKGRIRGLLLALDLFAVSTFVLTPLVALALVALPVLIRLGTGEGIGSLSLPLWLAAITLIVAWVRALGRPKDRERVCLDFGRSAQPELFDLLDSIARCLGTRPVVKVSMSPGSSFAVSEARPRFWGGSGDLHLRLDWNELWGLDLTELSGILLHEFAHYGIGHTSAARKLHRRAQFLSQLEARLAADSWTSWNPVYFWVRAFLRWFDRRYAAISRIEEAQADAVAIGLVGADAFTKGLEKSYRSGLETSGRLHLLLERALERRDYSADVLGQMAAEALQGADLEAFEAQLRERMEEPLHPGHSHPPFLERCAQAIRMRDAGQICAGVEQLPRGSSAYGLLFDLPVLRRHLSKEVVEGEARRRDSAIGLRGDQTLAPGMPGGSELFVARYHLAVRLATILFCGLGALVIGALALLAYERPADFGDNWPALAAMTLVLLGIVLGALRAHRSGLHAGPEGLEWRRAFGTKNFSWLEVQGLRSSDRGPQVLITGGPKIRIGGQARQQDAMLDLILEYAPELQVLGWGLGLSRVAEPAADVELPGRVFENSSGIVLEGPGRSRLQIREEHLAYAEIREALQTRLLPRMDNAS